MIVVGAGAAGLFCALVAADAGASRRAGLAHAARRVGQLLGPGRHRRRAGGGRQRRAPRRGHDRRRARRRAPQRGRMCCAATRPTGSATWSAWGCASTPIATARWRWASRAATRPGGSCTPAGRPRAAGSRASCPRWPRSHERVRVLEDTTATALLVQDGRCVGVAAHSEAGALTVAARGTVLATGGSAALWARSTNPAGSVGVGLALAHAAGARLADLEFMQFHPTALVSDSARDGFLITEAVRGEGALLVDAARRAVRGRAGPARPGGAGDRAAAARAGHPRRSAWTCARWTWPGFPTSPTRWRRRASTPNATWCRWRRPRTTRWAAWPPTWTGARRSTGSWPSASAPARASTAPTGWPRTRWPSASCSAAAPPRPCSTPPAACRRPAHGRARAAARAAVAGHPRRAVASRGPAAHARGACASWPATRSRWRAWSPPRRCARAESRGAHQRVDHPETDPAMDGRHVLLGPGERVDDAEALASSI